MTVPAKSLAYYDCIGSAAYTFMLKSLGCIADEEYALLKEGLKETALLAAHDEMEIIGGDDIAAIDNYLEHKLKALAKKVGLGRSRAQRHLLDMRLYWRAKLLELIGLLLDVEEALPQKALHEQPAQAALRTSLPDKVRTLQELYSRLNKLPENEVVGSDPKKTVDAHMLAKLLAFEDLALQERTTKGLAWQALEESLHAAFAATLNDLSKIGMQGSITADKTMKATGDSYLALRLAEDRHWYEQQHRRFEKCCRSLL